MRPGGQYSVFISHSTKDKELVEILRAFLESIDVRTFVDNFEVVTGESIVDRIVKGVYDHDYFCVILSPRATESVWVLRELQMAIWRWVQDLKMSRSFILPILREDCQIWNGIKDLLYIDFREDEKFSSQCSEIQNAILKSSTSEFFVRQKAFLPSPPNVAAYKESLKSWLQTESIRYIPRRLLSEAESRQLPLITSHGKPVKLLDLIFKERLISVQGDAGMGKSVELRMLARQLASLDSILIPIFVSLNKYVDDSLEDYIPLLRQFPNENTVLIIDGFDEIEAQHKNTAVRRIEHYAEHHPLCRIVLSSRTNLYQPVARFEQYFLTELTMEDAKNYMTQELGRKAKQFEEKVWKRDYHTLLTHPFYLHLLVDVFKSIGTLPQCRADLFEYFVQAQLETDLQKFRTAIINIYERKAELRNTLERLALIMETLGRNFIDEVEYRIIIPEEQDRNFISGSGLIKRVDGTTITWQFEHNSFQEYLAAKSLSIKSFDVIRKFVSFEPELSKTKPSWLNTLSFILSIASENKELFDTLVAWLNKIEPEVLLKSEPDRISSDVRFIIFKNIFEDHRIKRIHIGRNIFTLKDIGQFADSSESVIYLLDILTSETDPTILDNTVDILRFMTIQPSRRSELEASLLNIITNVAAVSHLRSSALLTLADQHLNSEAAVKKVVTVLNSSSDTWIRFALYYYLYTSEYLDENIDVFIEGLKYIQTDRRLVFSEAPTETRLGDESYHLKQGLERAKSPAALHKIIKYFKEHPQEINSTFLTDRFHLIVENTISAYKEDGTLYNSTEELFVALMSSHQEQESLALLSFFDATNTRAVLFNNLFTNRHANKDWFTGVGAVLNEELAERIAQAYLEGKITEDDVWVLRNFVLWKNENRTEWFIEEINKKTGNKFVLPPRRDYEAERKARFRSDLQLLFDKEAFISAIKQIYDKEDKNVLGKDEVHEVRLKRWDDPYFSELAIRELENFTKGHTRSFEEVKEIIHKSDWGYFRAIKIHQFMSHGQKVELSEAQWDEIRKWCMEKIGNVNFRTALYAKDRGSSSANQLAIILWYFIRHLNIDCPKNVLLDLLSFDWVENMEFAGIGYLEDRREEHEIAERILENLRSGITVDSVMKSHLEYCGRRRIEDVIPFAFNTIKNTSLSSDVREIAVNTLGVFERGFEQMKTLIVEVRDDFRWYLLSKTKDFIPDDTKVILKEIITNGPEEQKFKAAKLLVEMQDIDGLNYLVTHVRNTKRAPQEYHDESIFKKMIVTEAITPLMDLLDTTYEPDFVDNSFYSVLNIILEALTAIAITHKRYEDIQTRISEFIEKKRAQNDKVRYLHSYLNRLERDVRLNMSLNITLDDAIKQVDALLQQ